MEEEIVEPQAEVAVEEEVDSMQEDASNEPQEREEKHVPLSALQKERKKRQEAEMQLEYERRQRLPQTPPEEDNSRYESATKEDINLSQNAIMRQVEEKLWIKQNPEKFEKVNEYLPKFLKQRPNLASAIEYAENRYEEAYTLMEALTPKEQKQLKESINKREAPGSPSSIPKAANVNQAMDVMNMSDKEFSEWRAAQKRRR